VTHAISALTFAHKPPPGEKADKAAQRLRGAALRSLRAAGLAAAPALAPLILEGRLVPEELLAPSAPGGVAPILVDFIACVAFRAPTVAPVLRQLVATAWRWPDVGAYNPGEPLEATNAKASALLSAWLGCVGSDPSTLAPDAEPWATDRREALSRLTGLAFLLRRVAEAKKHPALAQEVGSLGGDAMAGTLRAVIPSLAGLNLVWSSGQIPQAWGGLMLGVEKEVGLSVQQKGDGEAESGLFPAVASGQAWLREMRKEALACAGSTVHLEEFWAPGAESVLGGLSEVLLAPGMELRHVAAALQRVVLPLLSKCPSTHAGLVVSSLAPRLLWAIKDRAGAAMYLESAGGAAAVGHDLSQERRLLIETAREQEVKLTLLSAVLVAAALVEPPDVALVVQNARGTAPKKKNKKKKKGAARQQKKQNKNTGTAASEMFEDDAPVAAAGNIWRPIPTVVLTCMTSHPDSPTAALGKAAIAMLANTMVWRCDDEAFAKATNCLRSLARAADPDDDNLKGLCSALVHDVMPLALRAAVELRSEDVDRATSASTVVAAILERLPVYGDAGMRPLDVATAAAKAAAATADDTRILARLKTAVQSNAQQAARDTAARGDEAVVRARARFDKLRKAVRTFTDSLAPITKPEESGDWVMAIGHKGD